MEFTVNTGVREGDALSLVLFNIALKPVVKGILQNESQGLNIGQRKQIALAAYAHNIVLVAKTTNSLKKTFDILSEESGKIVLIINENKTKFII